MDHVGGVIREGEARDAEGYRLGKIHLGIISVLLVLLWTQAVALR